MMATAVEAILGAVYLDGGDDALAGVMQHLGIVDPFHNSVTSKRPFPIFSVRICYDLLTLTCIGPFRKRLKVPFYWNTIPPLRV